MPTPKQAEQRVLAVPFQVGERGDIAFVTNPATAAAQEIKAALLTNQGERVMRPGIGSRFGSTLFAPIPSSTEVELMNSEILTQLSSQVQLSEVNSASISTDTGQLSVEVSFTPIAFAQELTITIPLITAVTTG